MAVDVTREEPIPLNAHRKAPASSERMSINRARELADEVERKAFDDVAAAFDDEALVAAAWLKMEDRGRYAELQAELRGTPVNLNDWKSAVKDAGRELKTRRRREGDARPVITDRADHHEVVAESCEALGGLGDLYERGGELVEMLDLGHGPELRPIPLDRLREVLSRAARFERSTDDGSKPIKPPRDVVSSLHARGQWGLPRLKGLVEGAAFLADGTIMCSEGYHPRPELYVRGAIGMPSGMKSPTKASAEAALGRLVELVSDFEFAGPREAHESAWVALLLTLLARPAIVGSTPLFLFDANRPRIGKTRLADIACEIVTGHEARKQAAPSGRDSDSEMRKTITGIARSGTPVVFFDNVKGKLGGPALELALTTQRWTDRILGESVQVDAELNLTWIATSNNAELTPDMHGRTLLVRLETDLEHPERRRDFRHPRIIQHVREHRDGYLTDALTILRAWHVAGQPQHDFTPWGSFEDWGRIIRNAMLFAGAADPCQTRAGLIEADAETRMMRNILSSWPEGESYTSAEIARGMKDGALRDALGRSHHEIVDALQEFLSSSSPRGIGRMLSTWRGRVVDGRRLVRGEDSHRKVAVWRVESVEPP